MDQNTELLLAKAAQSIRWEDEEKSTNDLAQLRDEFRRRLYGTKETGVPAPEQNGSPGGGS